MDSEDEFDILMEQPIQERWGRENPDPGQRRLKISEYQCGLVVQFELEKRVAAMGVLNHGAATHQLPSEQLVCASAALGIKPSWGSLPSIEGPPLVIEELPTNPSLLFMGYDRDDAADHMVRYLNINLINPPRDPLLVFQEERLRREKEEEERKRKEKETKKD